jgi:hypothetical protein
VLFCLPFCLLDVSNFFFGECRVNNKSLLIYCRVYSFSRTEPGNMFYLLFRREPKIPKTEFRGHILVGIKTNKNTREIGHKVDSKKQTMANYSNAGKNPSMNLDFSIPNFRQILWGERTKSEKFFFNQFQSTVGRRHTHKSVSIQVRSRIPI